MAPSKEGGGITLGVYVRPHSYKPYLHLCKPTENHLLSYKDIKTFKGEMSPTFKMSHLGVLHCYLSIEVKKG
jgi:hypothetical protein